MAASGPVTVRLDGEVAWVTIDSPPVNATSTPVRAGLAAAVEQVQTARVAILRCAGKTFIAGGDMTEFDRPVEEPLLPDVVQAIEDSGTPFLVAMHGNVLGGGFEIAMACAWRIALPGTKFGLPEVNVGLIPGAGGSQRLPRLVGFDAAIDIACSGKPISAEKLHGLGGLDLIADGDLEKAALDFVGNLPPRPTPVRERKSALLDTDMILAKRAEIQKRAKGQRAPELNLDAILWATLPFSEGQQKERKLHLELRASDESRALRHAFFAERTVSKPKAISNATAGSIAHVAVVGGGLMGSGIAGAMLAAGLSVTLIEAEEGAVEAAAGRVRKIIDGALARGKINADAHGAQLSAFSATSNFAHAATADLAIEAVFEDLAVKRDVFAKLSAVLGNNAILATNTSYLDPRDIFSGVEDKSRCVGLHFFSPAHIMRLLEVVRLPQTSPDVLATAFALARRMRKVAVLSGICDGFVGNRMLSAYRRQADYLLADGALPYQVDAAMRAFGMPMGPYELQDMTGLQIAWANRKRSAATRHPKERYVDIADRLCEMGRLGKRSGAGWYRYGTDSRIPQRDSEVEALIVSFSEQAGLRRQEFSNDEIANRMIAVLVNEGAKIIEEGIAESAADVDMVQIHGYGFPRWRGGPMHYADTIGLSVVAHAMKSVTLQSKHSWIVSKLLS